MLKVLLVCSGGMSSAIVVKAIEGECEKQGIKAQVRAVGTGEFEELIQEGPWDIALVAPQVRHRMAVFEAAAKEAKVPITLIIPQAYTPLGGPMLLRQIQDLIR
ncbi:PTS sugar transporter subunit IIB [Alkaliphilus crotonatoxidans]